MTPNSTIVDKCKVYLTPNAFEKAKNVAEPIKKTIVDTAKSYKIHLCIFKPDC
jgi:hypothetical protein